MSLTFHQHYNTETWQKFQRLFDYQKIKSAVTAINNNATKAHVRLRHYSEGFNYPMAGKAIIYAYIYKFHKTSFYTSIASYVKDFESLLPQSLMQCEDDNLHATVFGICAAIAEEARRKGQTFSLQISPKTKTLKALNFSGLNKELLEDVYGLIETIKVPLIKGYPCCNVSPKLGFLVGGADVQLSSDNSIWMFYTTLKGQPMTADKLQQALAYWILDIDFDKEASSHNWEEISFYFPRHKRICTLGNLNQFFNPPEVQKFLESSGMLLLRGN